MSDDVDVDEAVLEGEYEDPDVLPAPWGLLRGFVGLYLLTGNGAQVAALVRGWCERVRQAIEEAEG